jgi:hypothetical protein
MKIKIRLTLEQRAFIVYVLGNLGTGMMFVVLGTPELFSNLLAYYIIIPVCALEIVLMTKINIDGFRFGIVNGFLKNSRYKGSVKEAA